MPSLEQVGTFRGRIVSCGLKEVESGAKAASLVVAVDEIWAQPDGSGDHQWCDWRQYDCEATGDIWIIKKDGTLSQKQCQSLMEHAGWDGSLSTIVAQSWEAKPIQFTVEEDEYKGVIRYKIGWINAYDSTPGGGNVSAEKAKELDGKYGSQLRALAGNAARNAVPPTEPPPAKKSAAKPAPVPRLP